MTDAARIGILSENGVRNDFLQSVLAEMAKEWTHGNLYQLVGSADSHIKSIPEGSAGAMIFNTHTKFGPGQHWFAVFVDGTRRTAFLFDTLPNRRQPLPQQVTSQLAKMCDKFVDENEDGFQLQNPFSPMCGLYCLAWIRCHIRNEQLRLCPNDWTNNDIIVLNKVLPYIQKTFE